MINVGIGSAQPGIAASCQTGEARRRIGVAPSSARAGKGPSATIRRGAISTIVRCKNGKYVAISIGLGGRSPGGRQGISGARQIAWRFNPMLFRMCSRYAPIGPANELPERSASAFGASPTNNRPLAGSPSRNSRFVAVSRNALPSKPAIVARSSSSVVAAAAARAARSAGVSRPATCVRATRVPATCVSATGVMTGDRVGDAGAATGARAGGGRNRSTGSASSASSAPHSICNRKAVSASIIGVRCP